MNTKHLKFLFLAVLLSQPAFCQTYVDMSKGYAAWEAEDLTTNDVWLKQATPEGFTGNGYVKYVGPDYQGCGHDTPKRPDCIGPESERLIMYVDIKEAGLYWADARVYHTQLDGDNDAWWGQVGEPLKTFGRMGDNGNAIKQFGWANFHILPKDHIFVPACKFELPVGKHKIFFAGRTKELLQKLHATWDDIHFIDGYPDEYCCLARRKGKDWYIAAINAGKAKTIEIPLDFLEQGIYKVKIYTDGVDDELAIKEIEFESSKSIKLDIAKNGGFVFIVENSFK